MKSILLILNFLFFFSSLSNAQYWQSMAPAGGSVLSFVRQNNQTLVGTTCGVYRTTDNGNSFGEHSIGMTSGSINSMIEDDGVLIASIQSKGLYRSTDGGVNWSLSRPGNYLRQDGFGQQNLLRLGTMTVARNYGSGDTLYFTSDQGITWLTQSFNNSLFNNIMSAGGNLYTYSNTLGVETGVYRSADMGQSWQFINQGLPNGIYPADIHDIDGTLYLLSDNIYASTDDGLTWTQVTTSVLPSLFGNGNFYPQWTLLHDGRIYVQNGGNFYLQVASWAPGESGWQVIPEIPQAGNTYTFYSLGNTPCLSRIENQFRKPSIDWQIFQPNGINGTKNYGLFAYDNRCLTTSAKEMQSITDNQSTWTLTNPSNVSDVDYQFFSIAKTGTHLLMGKTNAFGVLDIIHSENDGATWEVTNILDLLPESRFLVGENEVYVYGGLGGMPYVFGLDEMGEISTEYGSPYGWTFDDFASDLTEHEGELFALTTNFEADLSKILRWNTNVGTFWSVATDQIDDQFFGARALTSWQGDLYLGMSDTDEWNGGVRKSEDNGDTWTAFETGIEGVEVNRFLTSGDTLFAATESGVFMLVSGTSNWEELSGNLPVAEILELARTNWYLYARLADGGVWRLSLSDEVSILDTELNQINPNVFPNPCFDQLYLRGLELGTYQIKWTDLQGKLIRSEVVNDISQPLSTHEFAPGVYLMQMENKNFRYSFNVVVK